MPWKYECDLYPDCYCEGTAECKQRMLELAPTARHIDVVITDYGGEGRSGLPLSPSRVARSIDVAAIERQVRSIAIVDAHTGLTATYRTDQGSWSGR